MGDLFDCLGEKLYGGAVQSAVVSVGCGKRLKEIFDGRSAKLAFLGGSVTYGYNSSAEERKSYADFLAEYLSERTEVEARNYAVSGTDCYMGLFVDELLVKDYAPQIVFVEYSINEELSPLGMEKYESLIRRLVSRGCVVIPVTVFNRAGYSCEEYMTHFSRLYGLPSVGIKAALYPLIQSGTLPMDIYTADEGHPKADIHEFIARCIVRAIDESIAAGDDCAEPPPPVTKAGFEDFKLLELSEMGWERTPFGGDVFDSAYCAAAADRSVKAVCSRIAVLYIKSSSPSYGGGELFCGGARSGAFSGYSLFGWGNPFAELIFEGERKERLINIRPQKGDEHKNLLLIAAGYC